MTNTVPDGLLEIASEAVLFALEPSRAKGGKYERNRRIDRFARARRWAGRLPERSGTDPAAPRPPPPRQPPGPPVANVTIQPNKNFNLSQNSSFRFTAHADDASGQNLPSVNLSYVSSDPTKVSVNAVGNATAQAVGSAQITVKADDKTSAPVTVTVTVTVVSNPPNISSLVTNGLPGFLDIGSSFTATATARDASDNIIPGVTFAFFAVDPDVASVDPNTGVVTGVSLGSTGISVSAGGKIQNAGTVVYITSPSQVLAKVCLGVPCPTGGQTVSVGASGPEIAYAYDAGDHRMSESKFSFAWASSNTAVATVAPASPGSNKADVNFVGAGTVNITATANGITGSQSFTVNP